MGYYCKVKKPFKAFDLKGFWDCVAKTGVEPVTSGL